MRSDLFYSHNPKTVLTPLPAGAGKLAVHVVHHHHILPAPFLGTFLQPQKTHLFPAAHPPSPCLSPAQRTNSLFFSRALSRKTGPGQKQTISLSYAIKHGAYCRHTAAGHNCDTCNIYCYFSFFSLWSSSPLGEWESDSIPLFTHSPLYFYYLS